MPRQRKLVLVPLAVLLLAVLACNLPGLGPAPTPFPSSLGGSPEAAYTAAAETIIAQLTQVSGPGGLTPAAPGDGTQTAMQTAAAPVNTPAPEQAAAGTPTPAADTAGPEAPPTAEPSATASDAAPTAAPPTAAATYPAGDPRAGLGEPTWRDTFEDGSNWYLYFDENAGFEVQEGVLVMTSYRLGTRNAWMLTQNQPLNFYLEIPFTTQQCAGLDRFGVIVRSADAATGYLFAMTCDGRYSFRSWNGTRANKLVEWTLSEAILTGPDQTNRLGIRVSGSQFSLYANGTLLTEVSDGSYPQGGFGVLIGSEDTEDFTVQVSEVAYWELP